MIHYELIKSYLMLLKVKCDNIRIMGIWVINTVASQQKDPEFDSHTQLSVWGLHVLSVFACFFSDFLPTTQRHPVSGVTSNG